MSWPALQFLWNPELDTKPTLATLFRKVSSGPIKLMTSSSYGSKLLVNSRLGNKIIIERDLHTEIPKISYDTY